MSSNEAVEKRIIGHLDSVTSHVVRINESIASLKPMIKELDETNANWEKFMMKGKAPPQQQTTI